MSQGFKPQPVCVVGDNGVIVPELVEILRLIAEADIILATGHLSVAEIKTVVPAALDAGVRKVLVNHPELWLIGMSIEDQRELTAAGAMMEVCARSATAPGHADLSPRILAERIMAVGVEHIVMATDYGQVDSPPAPEGMRWYIEQMLECGLAAVDVERMLWTNPARLLGL
jgi:predicted TIM-barrel fold metal-dependent hydrolase